MVAVDMREENSILFMINFLFFSLGFQMLIMNVNVKIALQKCIYNFFIS